jgi:uncharacterized membrane protein YhhN
MTSAMLIGVTVGAVASLLGGIRSGNRTKEFLSKTVASSCFVLLGWLRWTAGSPIETWIAVGLVLCAAGDLLLVSERTFDLGLLAFLSGHVAYAVAFVVAVPAADWPLLPIALLAVVSLAAAWWLWPNLGRRRITVATYIAVITVMVWGATSVAIEGSLPWTIAIGALLFYVSDIAVARHRFVRAEFLNRALGLPAYYAGQLLIAMSI